MALLFGCAAAHTTDQALQQGGSEHSLRAKAHRVITAIASPRGTMKARALEFCMPTGPAQSHHVQHREGQAEAGNAAQVQQRRPASAGA